MMSVSGEELTMQVTYLEYARMVGRGELWSRYDFMAATGKAYSTVRYHLDTAVKFGALNCMVGYVGEGNKVGWVYGLPETLPRLSGF